MENAYGVRARGRVDIGALVLPAPWKPTGTPLCDRVALRWCGAGLTAPERPN